MAAKMTGNNALSDGRGIKISSPVMNSAAKIDPADVCGGNLRPNVRGQQAFFVFPAAKIYFHKATFYLQPARCLNERRRIHSQAVQPPAPTKRSTRFPTLFVEFAILAFSERSNDLILHNVTRYFARLTQYYVLCYLVAPSIVLVPPLEQWVLVRVLVWWYPVLGRRGVLTLCRTSFWYLPIAVMNTEEGIAEEKVKTKAVLTSPFTFIFLFFILNAAIYDRAPNSPIISGAFQQLRGFPLLLASMGLLVIPASFFFVVLPMEVFSFGKGFEEEIRNAKAMKKLRAEISGSTLRGQLVDDEKSAV
ncbi:hypothetical protein C8J56DRAFT_902222 [Mycena floridula]|nr:hypothetical protein C8J56DRAFT_902222 [Mycena floridula]